MTHNPWATACPDWEARIGGGLSLVPYFPLLADPASRFAQEAAKALRIFGRLRIPDVIGTPTMAEACGPWVFPIVAALFGSYDADSNRRMIQEIFALVPKKNAKTSTSAAIMLTAILMNRRPEAGFQLIAPTKTIADFAFDQIRGTIKLDARLNALFHIQQHIRTITHRQSGARLQVKAADTDTVTGGKQLATLLDETHVFAQKPRAAAIFTEIRGALAARPDGFFLQITTQSKEQPSGVFKAELAMARAVRNGDIVLPLLPVLYEMPMHLQKAQVWKDRSWWPRLNPNFNRSVDEVFLANEFTKAEVQGTAAMALFASQHFNVEIGIGLLTDHWPGARHWAKNADPALNLAAIIARSDVITIGIDGGGLDDLLGLAVLGRDRDTRQWLHFGRAWLHEDGLEQRKSEVQKYRDMEAAGDLVIVTKMSDAFEQIADLAEEINDTGNLFKIGLDPVGVKLIVDALGRRGITVADEQVTGIIQGFRMSGHIKAVEDQLSDGHLVHGGQIMMDWCVGNCRIEVNKSNVTIHKQSSGIAKIDPVIALFIAAAVMMMHEDQDSIWDRPELAASLDGKVFLPG